MKISSNRFQNNFKIKKNRGFGLLEIIIGASIISVAILAAVSCYTIYIQYALANQKNVQASYLLEEGLEATSFLRDMGWTTNISPLSVLTTYYLVWNGYYWVTSTTPQYVDGLFLRSINLANVNRDSNGRIATSGTNDPNTKLITATVSYWQGHATTTQSISTYITNLYGN